MTRGSTGRGRNRRKAYLPARVGDLATSLADWRASSVSVDGQEQGFCPLLTSSPGYRGGARQGRAETRVVLGPPGGRGNTPLMLMISRMFAATGQRKRLRRRVGK